MVRKLMKRNQLKLSIFLLPLIAAIGLLVAACSEDQIDDAPANYLEKIGYADNIRGIIHYDKVINKWYVCSFKSDMNEDVRYNILSELDPVFQKENLIIYFSGEISQWKKEYKNPPITDNLIIYLSKIEVN